MSEFTVSDNTTTEQSLPTNLQTGTSYRPQEESKQSDSSDSSSSSSEDEEEEKKEEPEDEPLEVDYELITKKLLLPFFSIHSRILEKTQSFKIGPIEFYVGGTSPHKLGKVDTSTMIRCNETVKLNQEVQYIEIIPMRRNQVTSRTEFINQHITPYLQALQPNDQVVYKHGVFEIEQVKFLIKYSRPGFGYLGANTKVHIDEYAKPLTFARLAPIWKNEVTCREVMENFDEYEDDIRKNYLDVYFKGGLTRMVEKGETIIIDNMEFFVNDCRPKNGYVSIETTF